MGQGSLSLYAVAEGLMMDYVITAHKTGQIEGLGNGIEGDGTLLGILRHRLGGDVLVAVQNQI